MLENENVSPEAAIPTEEQSADNVGADNNDTTESTTQENVSENAIEDTSRENEGDTAPDFGLDIQYNKESLTLNREEAKDYAEQGFYYKNKVKPIFHQLDYLAAQKDTTVEALVEDMLTSDEAQYRAELVAKFGADDTETIEGFLEIRRNNQKQKYDKVVEDRKSALEQAVTEEKKSLESRLASEFAELKAEFPEITDFAKLPATVKAEAAKGRDLLSCYLRYKNSEEKRIAAANNAAKESSNASTGSGASNTNEGISESEKMFRNGLWGI